MREISNEDSALVLLTFTDYRILMNLKAEKMLSNRELLVMAAESKGIPGEEFIAHLKKNKIAMAGKLLAK